MTKTVNIDDPKISIKTLITLTKNGDEVVIEENGEPIVKVSPIEKHEPKKQRVFGLGRGTMWISEDFDDELPGEFWGFDKEL